MRCLYCGKELALLKRLTGGAEFCSVEHRQRYQAEYNELALSRLLQSQVSSDEKPQLIPDEPAEEVFAEPEPEFVPPPRSAAAAANGAYVETEAEEEEKLAPPVLDFPSLVQFAIAIRAGEGPYEPRLVTTMPRRDYRAGSDTGSLWGGSPVSAVKVPWDPRIEPGKVALRPRSMGGARGLEVREFSRTALTPVTLQHSSTVEQMAPASAFGESMEITNQPRPPEDRAVIWQAGPLEAEPVSWVLGGLARLDFATEAPDGWDARQTYSEPPVATLPMPEPSVQEHAPHRAGPEPISSPAPVIRAARESAQPVPEPAVTPLPVTLLGLGTRAAEPASVIAEPVAVAAQPQIPRSSAQPLRPTVVMGPAPVAEAPVAPAATSAATSAPEIDDKRLPARPTRPGNGGNGKSRRPDVRIIPSQPAQSAQPATVHASQPVPQSQPLSQPVAQRAAQPLPKPAPKPVETAAKPKSEPAKPIQEFAPTASDIDLGLPKLQIGVGAGPWQRMPGGIRAAVLGLVVLVIVGASYYLLQGSNASAKPTAAVPTYQIGKQINTGGWMEDWAPADSKRRITLLRGSQPYSDYRIEFEAQIQTKALGWMYRGLNPRNFYVVKVEKLKTGLEPVVAVVRYAVIDGKPEQRTEKPLPDSIKARVDTMYKIRFDAVGNQFAVWVQGQKIDEWRDTRLGSGGIGLYAENDESALVNGTVNVYELVSAK